MTTRPDATPAVADAAITAHPDLELYRLRAELALSLAPVLATTVDEPRDRGVLIADAVARWLELPAGTREHYLAAADASFSALELFGWDYHTQLDQAATAALPDPATVPPHADPEEVVRAAWRTVLCRVEQHRHIGGTSEPGWSAPPEPKVDGFSITGRRRPMPATGYDYERDSS